MTIDWEVALGYVDHHKDLLLELIDMFFVEHAELLPRIADAIEKGNSNELQLLAHRYKGCLRYFGDTEASEAARHLESLGRAAVLDDAPELLTQLRTAAEAILPELRRAGVAGLGLVAGTHLARDGVGPEPGIGTRGDREENRHTQARDEMAHQRVNRSPEG